MSKLTAVAVRNAKPQKKPSKLSDGKELHLHIAPTGLKSWRYRFRVDGKESTFVLGEYPTMSLQDARTARTIVDPIVKTKSCSSCPGFVWY